MIGPTSGDARVRRVIFAEHPDLIINCAVLGVDACELEEIGLAPLRDWRVALAEYIRDDGT